MDALGAVAVFGGAALIIGAIVYESRKSKNKLESAFLSIANFTPSQKFVSSGSAIAVDEGRGVVAIASLKGGATNVHAYAFRDVLSVEIYEDGSSVTKTQRSSQVGGALLGGALLGGVGAIIGGLSGKTTTTNKCNRIDLRLVVNDPKNPIHDMSFLNVEVDRGGFVYEGSMKNARHWGGVVEVLIRRADQEDKKSASNLAPRQVSVADELSKLVELRNSGVISAEEFQQQKEIVLRKG